MAAPYSDLYHLISGRKVMSQGQRMMTSNGATSSSQQNANRTEYLDTSTLKHLQLIAGPSHPKEQLPKGTDFLELANRVSKHIFPFVFAQFSSLNAEFVMFDSKSKRTRDAVEENFYFYGPANRINEHMFTFVLAERSMFDFKFLMFSQTRMF